jgi:cell wall-associated NlpC family hydrolase
MNTVVSHIPVIPLRSEPTHKAELISQLLFGETAQVIDLQKEWILVRTDFDKYSGWIEKEAVCEPEVSYFLSDKLIVKEPIVHLSSTHAKMIIAAGSELPLPDPGGTFTLGNNKWHVEITSPVKKNSLSDGLENTAFKFLNAPYLWGGRTIFGMDCSGFTQLIYKIHDLKIPRDAKDQALIGEGVKSLSNARKGDLLFFHNPEGIITHTGMLLDGNEIIHASKFVRIDRIDETGIYNAEQKKYTHKLNCIRRIS